MDPETEIILKEKDDELARLSSENAALKIKDSNEDNKALKEQIAKYETEEKELQDRLQQKELAEKRTALFKRFPSVSEDLIPATMPIDQAEELAGKLQVKFTETKPATPNLNDFDKGKGSSPAGNPGATISPKEQSLKDAQDKRSKFLDSFKTKKSSKNYALVAQPG